LTGGGFQRLLVVFVFSLERLSGGIADKERLDRIINLIGATTSRSHALRLATELLLKLPNWELPIMQFRGGATSRYEQCICRTILQAR
jgi:hypothetical protein